jgi:MarR family transcriptional regulator, lower aerobic nicotinate degradation pathway regulator
MATTAALSAGTAGRQSLVLLNLLARVARRSAEQALAPLGLRPRHVVLLTILRDHGSLTQGALGDALRLDPANVVGLLNELEERGLLRRRRDPDDRRRHIVELSGAGRSTLEQADGALESVQDELLEDLDADERATLHALLARAAEGQIAGACADGITEACIEAAPGT